VHGEERRTRRRVSEPKRGGREGKMVMGLTVASSFRVPEILSDEQEGEDPDVDLKRRRESDQRTRTQRRRDEESETSRRKLTK